MNAAIGTACGRYGWARSALPRFNRTAPPSNEQRLFDRHRRPADRSLASSSKHAPSTALRCRSRNPPRRPNQRNARASPHSNRHRFRTHRPPSTISPGSTTCRRNHWSHRSHRRHGRRIATLDWDTLAARVAVCERCRLCERRTNTVFGVGDRDADWMLIGEAPGENEDKQGEPFVGQAGKLLDSMLHAVTFARETNVYHRERDQVPAARQPQSRTRRSRALRAVSEAAGRAGQAEADCRAWAVSPRRACSRPRRALRRCAGRVHDYEGVPVIVTYHPAYLLRSLPDKAKAWADLCLAQSARIASRVEAQVSRAGRH